MREKKKREIAGWKVTKIKRKDGRAQKKGETERLGKEETKTETQKEAMNSGEVERWGYKRIE